MTRSSRQGKFVKKNLSAIQPNKPGEAIEVIKKVLQDLSISVEGIQRRTTSLEFGLDGAESDYDSESTSASDLIDEAQEGILALTGDADDLEARVTQAEVDIDGLETDVGTNTSNIGTLQDDVDTLSTNLSAIGAQVSTNESNIAGLTVAVDDLNVLTGGIQDDVATNAAAISTLETDVGTLETTVSGHTSTLAMHDGDIVSAKTRLDTAEAEIDTLQTDVDAAEATVATHTSEIAAVEADIVTIQSDITAIESDIVDLQADVVAVEAGVIALQRMDTDHFVDFTTSRWARWVTGTGAGAYTSSMIYAGPVSGIKGPGVVRMTGGSAINGKATIRSGVEQQIILTHGFEAEWFGTVGMNAGGGVLRFGFGRITSGVVPSANPYAYCEINAGDGDMWVLTDNGTNTATATASYTGVSTFASVANRYKLRVEGTSLQFFIDDTLTLTAANYVPVDDRTKSLSFFLSVDGLTSASWPSVDIDWIRMGVA